MQRQLLIVLLLLISVVTYGQDRVVSGVVRAAEDGTPLPGVNVVVKGTNVGATTDAEGNYKISLPSGSETLVFSFIGLRSAEVAVGGRTIVDVALEADITQLSEVVVVGYGTQIKQDLTGNIARVKGDEIRNLPVQTFEQSIQGRAAGVFVETGNGKLGQGVKMRIRGASSVTADNQPLFVVDNFIITNENQSSATAATNPLVDINPADIESIEILKDASASAIYGARAANGVVIITTKRGKAGRTSFNVGYQSGVSTETNRREFLNTAQYVELMREAGKASGRLARIESRLDRNGAGNRNSWADPSSPEYVNTDWQDQVFQRGKFEQIDVSAAGGNDKTKIYTSLSYSDQEGILIGNRFRRLTGRINLDHQASDKLTYGVNFNLAQSINNRLSDDNAFSTPMQIVALMPNTPVIDPRTGLLSGQLDPDTGTPNSNYPLYYNPLLDAKFSKRETRVIRNFGSAYAGYKITDKLNFRSEFGYDLLYQHEERYFGQETSRNSGFPNGFGTDAWTSVFNYTLNNFFSYNTVLNSEHTLEVIGGMSYQEEKSDFVNVEGQQFPSNSYKELNSAAVITLGSSTEDQSVFLSYFSRANYKFRDKYLFSFSGRVDGSSRFGPGNRFGFFPAVSAGWILTEEDFLSDAGTLEFLKFRVSYGLTGNAGIPPYASRGLFSGTGSYGGIGGARPTQLANDDLRWEQTTQLNVGFDFGFLNNRINGEIDYYVKKTSDLLLEVNLPATAGYDTQFRNIGNMENRGFEFVINSENLVGEFRWTTSLNYARNRNKITNLDNQVIEGSFLSRAVEGEPIGIFFGPQYAGVDPANGDALYTVIDSDGNRSTTNNVNNATLMKVGDPNPDFIAGMTNTFSYKGLELSILFQGVFGYQVYNGGGKFMTANGDFFDNQTIDQLRRWQNVGDITDVPQARYLDGNGTAESSRYVYDAGYLRLKTVTLGYNLPKEITGKAKLTSARVYVSAQNLLTFTNYEGWDPEVNADTYASNINQGIDFYSAPQPKTITFGINIGF
ncbi:MAG: TonB-dependent receptor [Cyclobacteriaceae bacterium]|nr:TonB-dependent receptor [Cytophagales bacterium]MCZ8328710.1 TonB-dependent receptor [Cyclobacteriaceae bacterium]